MSEKRIRNELIRFCLRKLAKLECKVPKINCQIKKVESDLISSSSCVVITDDESTYTVTDDEDEQFHEIVTDDECFEEDGGDTHFLIPNTVAFLKSEGFEPPKNLISSEKNVKLCSDNNLVLRIALYKILGDLIMKGISQLFK